MMKNKKNLFNSIIIAGIIILCIGLYYLIIKAGIPFQDAPVNILALYEAHMDVGEVLTKYGFITLALGILYQVIKSFIKKSKNIEPKTYNIHGWLLDIFIVLVIVGSVLAIGGYYNFCQYQDVFFPSDQGFFLKWAWEIIVRRGVRIFLVGAIGSSIILIIRKPKEIRDDTAKNENNIEHNGFVDISTSEDTPNVYENDSSQNENSTYTIENDTSSFRIESNLIENEQTKEVKESSASKIIGYIILGIIWSAFCFFTWVNAVFTGNWHWSREELIANDPIGGRIAILLANGMPIIWIAVPVIIAIIVYVIRKKRDAEKDETGR